MWILGLLFMGLAASSLSGGDGSDDDGTETGFASDTETDDDTTTTPIVSEEGDIGILLEGGASNNDLTGTHGPDLLDGKDGDDTLRGQQDDDNLFGSEGDDALFGGDGDDYLTGGEGDDALYGDSGNDTLIGYTGQDTLEGGSGDDWLFGADLTNRDPEVADSYLDREPDTELETQEPTDTEEADKLYGGAGNDNLILGAHDTGTGGDGNDTFNIGHWVEEDAPLITDFNPEEDMVSIIVPDTVPLPTITLERVGDETHVLADDVIMARITGSADGFDASDVTFVTL
ncbi:hypothetical protein [uncultured Shimia sp.]|uniref:calcium-binding protein n=1 Tax=uncultured Shimia sp. TaxID=573152 RepID=UPI0025E3991C|nr:hypothetical protein [uncultured Shimia sp.]